MTMQKAASPIPLPCPSAALRPAPSGDSAQHALWKLLDALALCRAQYNLSPNSLSVLRALISFLPKTTTATDALLVWPSNRSLCERADGMDERTLRRHLDRLVKAELIFRRSSSNGKRFALRCRKTIVMAFGFDLGPLLERAEEIIAAAQNVRNRAEQATTLRVEILNLLHALGPALALEAKEEAGIRRALRRRADPEKLSEMRDKLMTANQEYLSRTDDLTASDSQIDRHQQKTEKDYYASVCRVPNETQKTAENRNAQTLKRCDTDDDITLEDCLDATTESRSFAQEPVRNWADLMRLADTLAPMIGIDRELSEHTKRAMGPLHAAISTLCIIQRSGHIQRPAAYLRRLAILAEAGQYSLRSLVRSTLRQKFTAANPEPA